MSCSYADWDGAYVLGSLPPGDRLEFERHLGGCEPCTLSVRQMAGLPGLLGRVDESTLDDPEPGHGLPPVPATLLPRLRREVRARSRRRLVAVGLVAASTAAAVTLALPLVDRQGGSSPGTTAGTTPGTPSSTGDDLPSVGRPMRALGGTAIRARLSLAPVAWGTRLDLVCSYEPTAYLSGARGGTYTLLVHAKDGGIERVGTWRPVAGRAMRLSAATALDRGDIASVEVETAQGQPVLRLDR